MIKIHSLRFKKIITNLTRGCLFKGHIVDGTGERTATEEVNQTLRVTKRAIIEAGDHLLYSGRHYAASIYSREVLDDIYRLIPLPDFVNWQLQRVIETDPVTGLQRPVNSPHPPIQQLWCKKVTKGFKSSVKSNQDEVICYWMTDTVSVGDTLDGRLVKQVIREQDVYKVEV